MQQLLKKLDRIKSYGNSMEPLIQDGDVVSITKIPFNQIAIDDIAVIYRDGMHIMHRVVYKTNTFIVTKGDTAHHPDGKVYSKSILGIVTTIRRNGITFSPDELYVQQSMIYFQEIVALTELFEKAKITYVILKGLPLHLWYEKRFPRRLYDDCDLLVSPRDYQHATQLLIQRGYRLNNPSRWHHAYPEVNFFKTIHRVQVVVDLHREAVFLMTALRGLDVLYPRALVDQLSTLFLEKKQYVTVQSKQMPILSHEHLIVYLALHFFHHNFKGMFRLKLLHQIIVRGFDDRKILKLIAHFRLEGFAFASFALVNKYFNSPISARFLSRIRPQGKQFEYIKQHIIPTDVCETESKIDAGVRRFQHLFFLSPYSLMRKIWIFADPGILSLVIQSMVNQFLHRLAAILRIKKSI